MAVYPKYRSPPTFVLLDWVRPAQPRGLFAGSVLWVLEYGWNMGAQSVALVCPGSEYKTRRALASMHNKIQHSGSPLSVRESLQPFCTEVNMDTPNALTVAVDLHRIFSQLHAFVP